MHHPHSARVIFYFRLSAFLLLAKGLAGMTGLGLLGLSACSYDYDFARIGAGVLGVGIALAVFQWLAASSARCPLCMMQVLSRKNCSKHRKTLRILGSHRLPVAVGVISHGRFCCPYCHEMTELSLRRR